MGEGRILDAVPVAVDDADVETARAALIQSQFGIARPTMLAVGLSGVLFFGGIAIALMIDGQRPSGLWIMLMFSCPVIFMAAFDKRPPVLQPSRLTFCDKGLVVELEGPHVSLAPRQRTMTWRWIRSIDDAGDLFLVRAYFGTPIIVPKRSFADGGVEARACFAAHGVAGRALSVRAVAA